MKINALIGVLAFWTLPLQAQMVSLSLDSCQAMAKRHYPMARQFDLLAKSEGFALDNAAKGFWPQVSVLGQASYQSDVTKISLPIPGIKAPEQSKDQYKLYADINQPVYEGGLIKQQKQLVVANTAVEAQKIEVELYKLNDRVNQLFFGILLLEEQLRQVELLKKDIQLGLNKINGAIANGTAFRSNADVLKAELLKADQRTIDLKAARKAYRDMLGLLTGQPLDESAALQTPVAPAANYAVNRPELLLYDLQNKGFDVQNKLLTAKNRPKVNVFLQAGIGRPAFNIFSTAFDPYYIGGLRLNVPLTGFYTLKNDREALNINRSMVNLQKETFLFNTQLSIQQQSAEVARLLENLNVDKDIIALRTSIKQTASAQLENGVITSSDYLREVNAEDSARQNQILHQIQLLQAQFNQKYTTGN